MIPSEPPKLQSRLPRKLKAWIEEVRSWMIETQAIPGKGLKARETARGRLFKVEPVTEQKASQWFGVRARKTSGAQTISSVTTDLVTFDNDSTVGNYDTAGLFASSIFTAPDSCYVTVNAVLPFRIGTNPDTLATITVELEHTPFGESPVVYPQVTTIPDELSSGGLPYRIPVNYNTTIYVGARDTLTIQAARNATVSYTIDSGSTDGALLCITRAD